MSIHLSELISWAIISFGNINGTIPGPGCFLSGSMKGGMGFGRSGSIEYHFFGMLSSSKAILVSTVSTPYAFHEGKIYALDSIYKLY